MGKLFMYSDQVIDENRKIDKKLFESFGKAEPAIAYIPCNGDGDRSHYRKQLRYYQRYGLGELLFFDIADEYDEGLLETLMESDAIHLSGGSPLIFRENLRKRGLDSFLIDYYNKGGILAGVSGGAVQFGLGAGIFDLFQNGLESALQTYTQLETMQVVPFEFLPHYNRWSVSFKQSVEEYTLTTGRMVYAAEDGDGIIADGKELTFIGNVKRIQMGRTESVL